MRAPMVESGGFSKPSAAVPTPPGMIRTRSFLISVVALLLLGLAPALVSGPASALTPPAPTNQDVTGIWAIRQGQDFTPSVYGLDIAGYTIRLYWKDVEPQRGVYNWSLFDNVLAQAKAHG